MKFFRFSYIFIVVLIPLFSSAQSFNRDVVFLKNGSIIKGTILEVVPDTTVKIQTADGSVFIYSIAEILKVEKETTSPSAVPSPVTEGANKETKKTNFSILGGAAIPVGDFAKQTDGGGSAKTGFTVGVQFVTPDPIGWIINASYSQNSFQAPSGFNVDVGNWKSFLLLTGLKIGTENSSEVNFIFAPMIGVLFGTSPDMNISTEYFDGYQYRTVNVTQNSASGTAFAYGAAIEILLGSRILLAVQYIGSEPKYNVSASANIGGSIVTASGVAKQSTAFIMMYLGVTL